VLKSCWLKTLLALFIWAAILLVAAALFRLGIF
jgi:hypothetical protein